MTKILSVKTSTKRIFQTNQYPLDIILPITITINCCCQHFVTFVNQQSKSSAAKKMKSIIIFTITTFLIANVYCQPSKVTWDKFQPDSEPGSESTDATEDVISTDEDVEKDTRTPLSEIGDEEIAKVINANRPVDAKQDLDSDGDDGKDAEESEPIKHSQDCFTPLIKAMLRSKRSLSKAGPCIKRGFRNVRRQPNKRWAL